MSAASNYLEVKILDHTLGEGLRDYTSPANLYVGLFTGTAATVKANIEAGTFSDEVASSYSYARTAVTFAAASTDGSGVTSAASSGNVTFPTANGGAWGTITVIGIFDGNTRGGNNCLYYGELTASKTVSDGDTFQISSGSLTVSLA